MTVAFNAAAWSLPVPAANTPATMFRLFHGHVQAGAIALEPDGAIRFGRGLERRVSKPAVFETFANSIRGIPTLNFTERGFGVRGAVGGFRPRPHGGDPQKAVDYSAAHGVLAMTSAGGHFDGVERRS